MGLTLISEALSLKKNRKGVVNPSVRFHDILHVVLIEKAVGIISQLL